jgi:hypothetical protein
MLHFGASLTDDTSSVNYDRNLFIIHATGLLDAIVSYDRKKFYSIGPYLQELAAELSY